MLHKNYNFSTNEEILFKEIPKSHLCLTVLRNDNLVIALKISDGFERYIIIKPKYIRDATFIFSINPCDNLVQIVAEFVSMFARN